MSDRDLEILMKEARIIIRDIGLTEKMLGDTPVYVFLTLLGMSLEKSWEEATNELWRITPLMEKIEELGWASFKPNTRETIRDECVGILVDAYLVTPNPDDPQRSKNSSKYCYQINNELLELVQYFGSQKYSEKLSQFLREYQTLTERYEAARESNRIPVKLPNGKEITLSPGGQNPLIASIIQEFAPQFKLDTVLYIGDAEKRYDSIFEQDFLSSLDIDMTNLTNSVEMPDVILYRTDKNTLAIVEAVKTSGEINVERRDRLLNLFQGCSAHLAFINAFESFTEFKKIIKTITWETHVWLAESPTHLIHFNGDKYWLPTDSK